jgi:predicted glycoside hydrolase/deacetylase ChbG (UPF0249 family)
MRGAAVSGPQRRLLSICADDFGLSMAVSLGIAELAQRGRLSAVSCMTSGERWLASAPRLADLPASVERGLHFNLTEGAPLSLALRLRWPRLPALPRLVSMAHLGRLPLQALGQELKSQWQRFVDTVGEQPRFIDGHQHVHHLPGVRDLVLAEVAAAGVPVAVRNTGSVRGPGNAVKRMLIERTGGAALERRLQRLGVEHNRVLLGVYDFRGPDYRRRMQGWLATAPADGGLLLCHPCARCMDPAAADPIGPARLREGAYLGSGAFDDDLAAAGITLVPTWIRTSSGD